LQASNAGEQLNGREGNDTITGGVGNDNINGNTGNDIVSGGAGDDTVRGGKDDDQINGNDGSDQVYGDLGNDTLNGNQGQDYVYGGPGDDVVQGGQGDDFAVHGDEGNDWVYGDLGNDADVNGNQGNDHVYGGDGNDVVRGGQGDDYVSGDAGDDMVYGGLGNNILVGGSGRDTFIIAEALNVQNTILDFERGSDRIDLTAFAYLSTYDQLVMHQDGANTVIQLSPSNRLIIGGQTPNQIQSTDFVGPWTANKTIYLWLPGLLHDRITQEFLSKGGANATTPTGRPVINVQEYRISGFNPLANPGNLLPYKPFQLIDLRSVSVSQVTWRQDGNDTLVDLDSRFGKVLRLIGVTASQITLRNFLTMNQDEQVAIRSYLADWTDQTQVERYVVPPADQFLTEGNRVIYESTPAITYLANKSIPQVSSTTKIVTVDPSGSQLQFVSDFAPANPLHKIDLTDMGVPDKSFIGFEQVGPDAKLNFPDGKSLVLKNALIEDIARSTFVGWATPSRYEVFLPDATLPMTRITGFTPDEGNQLLDLRAYLRTNDFSEITVEAASSNSTKLTFQNTPAVILLVDVAPSQVNAETVIGPESPPGPSHSAANLQTAEQLRMVTFSSLGADVVLANGEAAIMTYGGHTAGQSGGGTTYSLTTGQTPLSYDPAGIMSSFSNKITQASSNYLNSLKNDASNADAIRFIATTYEIAFEFDESLGPTLARSMSLYSRFATDVGTKLAKNGMGIIATFAGFQEDRERLLNALTSVGLPNEYAESQAFIGAAIHTGLSSVAEGLGGGIGAFLGGVGAFGSAGTSIFWGALAGKEIGTQGYTHYLKSDVDSAIVGFAVQQYFSDVASYSNHESYSIPPVFSLEEATETETQLLSILPAGGATYVDGFVIEKSVIDGEVLFTRRRTDNPGLGQTYGIGVSPNELDEFQSNERAILNGGNGDSIIDGGSDQDTMIGGVLYSNGKFYKLLESGFEAVVDAADDLRAIAEGRFFYRDGSGAATVMEALVTSIDLSSVISESVTDWYNSLTQERVIDGQPIPSGIMLRASQTAGTFLAEFALNGDFDAAVNRAKNGAIRSEIDNVRDAVLARLESVTVGEGAARSVLNSVFSTTALAGDLGISLAKTIGEQLVRGNFNDSFASEIVTQSAIGYGLSGGVAIVTRELGGSMTAALAEGLGFGAAVVPVGFDPISIAASIIIQTLLNQAFSEEIAEVSSFVGDVGEEVWDFVRDPVNSIKSLFDDPKFSSVNGTEGSDTLYQPSNSRTRSNLLGGNDVIFGGDGWGIILGGHGDDILIHGNTVAGGGVPGNGVGELYGEEGADYIDAGGGNDELYGGGGADVLFAGSGDDVLAGGDASPARTYTRNTGVDEGDYLSGGLGNDTFTGGAGRDTFAMTLEAGARDVITDFHPGEDWIDLSQFSGINDLSQVRISAGQGGAVVNLPGAQTVVLLNITSSALQRGDFIFSQYGTSGNDILNGSDAAEVFNGLDGNDDLRMGGGNDIANGNVGDDLIAGGTGDDRLRGGQGNDTIAGGEGDDYLWGDLGNDQLNGNQGNDHVDGGDGNDVVRGGRGDDVVIGGVGDDEIYGGLGNDIVVGGQGADRFYITPDSGSTDLIVDWIPQQHDHLSVVGFNSFPLTAGDVTQVGYDTYLFLPNSQRVVLQYASAEEVKAELMIGNNPTVPPDTPVIEESPPVLMGLSSTLIVPPGSSSKSVMRGAKIQDPDSPDLDGGSMTIALTSGSGMITLEEDEFSPRIRIANGQINWNGFSIGTYTVASTGAQMIVQFNGNATPIIVEQFMPTLKISNMSIVAGSSTQFSVVIADGDGAISAPFVRTVTVSSNDAPTLAGASALIFKEKQAATVINGSLVAADVDNTTLASATIQVSSNYTAGEDLLGFLANTATMGNIVGSFDSVSGTLTLTSAGATATRAQFQAALRLVTYRNLSSNPTSGVRSVAYQISDGTFASNTVTSLVAIVAVDDASSLDGVSTLAYTEKQNATALNPNVTLSDRDNSTLAWATVNILTNYSATQDLLGFVGDATTGNITGSFNAGTLTLMSPDATATVAQFQAALRLVTYVNTSSNPSTLTRSVVYQVSDGSVLSNAVTSTITVATVNDAPTLSGIIPLIFLTNQPATVVNAAVIVGDVDNRTLATAKVRISANYVANEDVLGFVANVATTGNIVGSFDSTSGTMTLTSAGATATLAQFQAALRLVTYRNTRSSPTVAARSVQYQLFDGKLNSNTLTNLVTIKVAGAAIPTVSGSATLAYVEKQPGTVINSSVTVSDTDSPTLAWATVKVSTNFSATQDLLEFAGDTTTANIVGSYNAATGTMTLISAGASATVAQFQSALRRVTYRNTSVNPSILARSIQYVVSDGSNVSASSAVNSSTVSISAVNDAPKLLGMSSLIVTEKQAAIAVNTTLAVDDADNTTLTSATVRISGNYSVGEDVLAFAANTTTGNIAGSFDSQTGTLTLTSAGGTATVSQFQSALRLVTYRNTSFNLSKSIRSVAYQIFDATLSSYEVTSLVSIVSVNDAPVIAGAGTLAYTEKQSAKAINPNLIVNDVDNATLLSATVTLSANYFATQDFLSFIGDATTGNITGSFNAGTLTLISVGGTATAAQFQAALRFVTYLNSSSVPSTLTRSVTYQISDGTVLSNTVISTITIAAVNDAPTLSGVSTLIFKEKQAATLLNTFLMVGDTDNTNLASATVRVSANYSPGEDLLGFVANAATTGNIAGSFNTSSGILTLTSAGASATLAQFQAALRLVTYGNTSSNPWTAARSIDFHVSDGILASNKVTGLVTIVSANDAPTIAGVNALAYTEKQSAAAINPIVVLADGDHTTLVSATVKLTTNYLAAQDVLGFIGGETTGNISGNYHAGTLTLTSAGGKATVAQFQSALRSVTYLNTSSSPSTLPRSVTYQVSDGSVLSNIVTSAITISAINDAPTLKGTNAMTFAKNGSVMSINRFVVVADSDNTTLALATVRISTNYVTREDVLGFVANASTTGNIIGNFDSQTGIMTLSSAGATATLAQFQAALRLVTYLNTSASPSMAPRSLHYQVFDGSLNSSPLTSMVTIKGIGAAPVVAGVSLLAYREKQGATVINSNITVSDVDSTTLAWAFVKMTTGYQATQDILDFIGDATTGNISSNFNPATGTMTLISEGASATAAQFQSALRRVTYRNTSAIPSLAARSVTYEVSDGTTASNIATSSITIAAVNDSPTLVGLNTLIFTEKKPAAAINTTLVIADADNTTLTSATVRISANYSVGEDVLGFVANTTTGNIAGSFDSVSGMLTLTSAGGTATVAQFQAALGLVTYLNTSSNPSTAVRSVDYQVSDATLGSNILTSLITIVSVSDAPLMTGLSTLSYNENQAATAINPTLKVSDADNTTFAWATVEISGNYSATQDLLEFVGDVTTGNIVGSFNAVTGRMTLTSEGATATAAQFQVALRLVTYRNSSANPSKLARSIQYVLSDGSNLSAALTSTVNIN
jgi:Ca2+-binding RTX toxin-like protein